MKKRQGLQAGFTLVEMIVVMAIMAILAGAAVTGLSMIRAGNAKKAAARFASALQEAQVETMSKKDAVYLYLYRDSSDKWIAVTSKKKYDGLTALLNAPAAEKKDREVGDRGVSITFQQGGSKTLGNASNSMIRIVFKRENGTYNVTQSGAFSNSGLTSNDFISEIFFKGKGSFRVKMVKDTGKFFIER